MKETRLAYKHELINKIGSYLATKPWGEVAQLITALQKEHVEVEIDIQETADAEL